MLYPMDSNICGLNTRPEISLRLSELLLRKCVPDSVRKRVYYMKSKYDII